MARYNLANNICVYYTNLTQIIMLVSVKVIGQSSHPIRPILIYISILECFVVFEYVTR